MSRRWYVFLAALIAVLILASIVEATIKNPSEHRKPIKPLVGNVIFGNDLPYQKEDEFVGVKNEFVLGEDETIRARAYYPMLLSELWEELRTRASKVLGDPQFQYHGTALYVKDAETGDRLFMLDSKAGNPGRMTEWDQEQVYLLDTGEEKCDLWCDERDEAWEKYPMKYPFPDALADKPGKYQVDIEFYDVFEGKTGEYEVSWDEWGEDWEVTANEGRASFVAAKGSFTLIVPE